MVIFHGCPFIPGWLINRGFIFPNKPRIEVNDGFYGTVYLYKKDTYGICVPNLWRTYLKVMVCFWYVSGLFLQNDLKLEGIFEGIEYAKWPRWIYASGVLATKSKRQRGQNWPKLAKNMGPYGTPTLGIYHHYELNQQYFRIWHTLW